MIRYGLSFVGRVRDKKKAQRLFVNWQR